MQTNIGDVYFVSTKSGGFSHAKIQTDFANLYCYQKQDNGHSINILFGMYVSTTVLYEYRLAKY